MVDALTEGLVKKIEEEKINYLNSLLERAKEKGWKAELVVKKHSNTVDSIVEFVKEGDYDLQVSSVCYLVAHPLRFSEGWKFLC
jgi:predicted RNase H-like nuclease (RuvC/YqgF family)